MESAVAHLNAGQQQMFVSIMKSAHNYSTVASVDESSTYEGVLALWSLYDEASKEDHPYVPARVEHIAKLAFLFDLFANGAALLFVLSNADAALCMFQHGGETCNVEFEAPMLQERVKQTMWDNKVFGTVCWVWVYRN
jgi:hypothetical protein